MPFSWHHLEPLGPRRPALDFAAGRGRTSTPGASRAPPSWPRVAHGRLRRRARRHVPRDPDLHRRIRHGVLQRPHGPAPVVDHGGRPRSSPSALRSTSPTKSGNRRDPSLPRRSRSWPTFTHPLVAFVAVLRLHPLHAPDGVHEPHDGPHVDPPPRADRLPRGGLPLLSRGLRTRARLQAAPGTAAGLRDGGRARGHLHRPGALDVLARALRQLRHDGAVGGDALPGMLSNIKLGGGIMWIGGDALMLLALIPIGLHVGEVGDACAPRSSTPSSTPRGSSYSSPASMPSSFQVVFGSRAQDA